MGFLGMSGNQWGAAGRGASGVLEGYGAYQSYNARAQWQAANSEVTAAQGAEAQNKARWQVTRQQLSKRKWIGGSRAMFGWVGVELEGSPMDVLAEADREMTMDEIMTTREGSIEQQMKLQEAQWQRKAASASRSAANTSMIGGMVQGGAAIASIFAMSDERWKENIHPVTDALAKLRELTTYQYNYKGTDQERIGMLAQEVEKQLPEAVQDKSGAKAVELYALQSLIVGAIKELQVGPAAAFGSFA